MPTVLATLPSQLPRDGLLGLRFPPPPSGTTRATRMQRPYIGVRARTRASATGARASLCKRSRARGLPCSCVRGARESAVVNTRACVRKPLCRQRAHTVRRSRDAARDCDRSSAARFHLQSRARKAAVNRVSSILRGGLSSGHGSRPTYAHSVRERRGLLINGADCVQCETIIKELERFARKK